MGSSAPQVKEVKPKVFESVIPLSSYKMAADYLSSIRKDTQTALNTRYASIGTPAQLGASTAGYKAAEEASYLSSLPTTDKYMKETTGMTTDAYAPAKQATAERLSAAQEAYGKALENVDQQPAPISNETPSWAKGTTPAGLPAMPPGMEDAIQEAQKMAQNFREKRSDRIQSLMSNLAVSRPRSGGGAPTA